MNRLAQVEVSEREGVPIVMVAGEIDLTNADEVRQVLLRAVGNTAHGLVVDLSRTNYLDSRGIHLLFEVSQRLRSRQQALHVVLPERSPLRRLLALAALDSAVSIDAVVDSAVEKIRPRQ
jgi:anti-anti-sigma factor